jgi:hypothetical protein
MARHSKPGTARIDHDISIEAKLRFERLHASLGFKTKAETLEAIFYFVSTKDTIDPHTLERIERKVDGMAATLETLA